MYEWDETKRADNRARHGVDFADMAEFEWDSALTRIDARRDYPEPRFVSIGYIGQRVHVLVWTQRGQRVRLISARKANRREVRHYAKTQ